MRGARQVGGGGKARLLPARVEVKLRGRGSSGQQSRGQSGARRGGHRESRPAASMPARRSCRPQAWRDLPSAGPGTLLPGREAEAPPGGGEGEEEENEEAEGIHSPCTTLVGLPPRFTRRWGAC